MVRTIKVLNALFVVFTKQAVDAFFVFKVDVSEDTISFYNLIQNIEVQWQFVNTFHLFDEFSANWASHSIIMVQSSQTLRTKSVAAVNHDSRNFLSDIELTPTIVTIVETTAFVISAHQIFALILVLLI